MLAIFWYISFLFLIYHISTTSLYIKFLFQFWWQLYFPSQFFCHKSIILCLKIFFFFRSLRIQSNDFRVFLVYLSRRTWTLSPRKFPLKKLPPESCQKIHQTRYLGKFSPYLSEKIIPHRKKIKPSQGKVLPGTCPYGSFSSKIAALWKLCLKYYPFAPGNWSYAKLLLKDCILSGNYSK